MPEIEIMSPAGSFDSLMAAIQGGAGSVYFGAGQLNMRARSSSNFSPDDIRQITAICRENGVRSYLTLNTIIYDEELPIMREMVDLAKESGIQPSSLRIYRCWSMPVQKGLKYTSLPSAISPTLKPSDFTQGMPM